MKRKLTYAEFVSVSTKGTVAWVLERVMNELNGWAGGRARRPMLASQIYTLRGLQRSAHVGAISCPAFVRHNLRAHCHLRQERDGVGPATLGQDVNYLC